MPRGLRIVSLTPDRWDDFETLFGPRGAVAGCWCMWWRVKKRSDWERGKGARNKSLFKAVVRRGDEPGLLAYHDGRAVGPRWTCRSPPYQPCVMAIRYPA